MDEEKKVPEVPEEPTGVVDLGHLGQNRTPPAGETAPPPETEPQGVLLEDLLFPQGADPVSELEKDLFVMASDPSSEAFFAENEEEAPGVDEEPTAPVPAPKKTGDRPRPGAPRRQGRKPAPKKRKTKKAPSEPEPDPREEERNYLPIRTRRDGRLGCLGGIMYAMFIICASIALAVFAWMSAADVLALNKSAGAVEVTLTDSMFTDKEVEVKDADGNVTGTKIIRAAKIRDVAGVLKDYGLINYKWLFSLYSSFSHADEQLDPGTYVLSTNLDYRAIVKKMQAGADSQLQTLVTLPEGFTMDQIFARLEEKGVCSKEDLYAAAANTEFTYAFLEGMETGDPYRLEGYLFPDTYYFYQGMQASSAVNRFLSNFHYLITDEMWQQTKSMGLSFREMLTIASLIEKEAANDAERPLIAAVIYNRLRGGMPLQIDSSVLYALRDKGENVKLTVDLIQSTVDPYNTYLYTGLPPGPICNPGMASIQAALNPSNAFYYLYYALDTATGEHRFFTSLEEHEAFVATQNYG